jgi:hypothetical protein
MRTKRSSVGKVSCAGPVHQSLSSQLGNGACILLDLFQDLTDAIFLWVGDVPVDNETYVCCFYPLSIFKSTPTSNGEGMGRK